MSVSLDAAAVLVACAARDLATSGIEMILVLEDCGETRAPAGEAERTDGQALANLMQAAVESMYPDAATRDVLAVARVSEVVAAYEFGDYS